MRKRFMFITAGVAAAALALAGCSDGDADPGSTEGGGGGAAAFEVAKDVTLEGSPTFDKMKSADKVRIGVKEDQPGLGYLDAATGERSGFDIQIATWIAASLGFDADKIEFKAIPSANRESAIVNGDIDYYVGSYSITDKRKTQIDFAGPYLETGQSLLVKKDDTDITSEQDLSGKTVCSVTGSTPLQYINDNFPDTKTVPFDTYSQCVDALNDGKVDAVTTDQSVLIGYAALEPEALKVVGKPFTTELIGVGLPKGDDELRHFINEIFTDGSTTWTALYEETLGVSGIKLTQPKVDDY